MGGGVTFTIYCYLLNQIVSMMKYASLIVLCVQAIVHSSAASIPLFPLPAVDFADLTVQDERALSLVANALTTGIFVIMQQ